MILCPRNHKFAYFVADDIGTCHVPCLLYETKTTRNWLTDCDNQKSAIAERMRQPHEQNCYLAGLVGLFGWSV